MECPCGVNTSAVLQETKYCAQVRSASILCMLGCERLMPLINYLVILVRLVVRAPSVLVVILAILVLLVLMFFRVILWSSWWLRSSGLPDSSLSYLMWLPRQLMCSWTASCSALGHIVLCSRVANPRLAPTGQPEADQKATIQG